MRESKSKLYNKYGTWAVITGASDGIGKAFAEELASHGFNLVLVARRKEILEDLSKVLISKYGIKTLVLSKDLGDLQSSYELLNETADLDVGLYVGSAGFGTTGNLITNDIRSELDMLNVNCNSLLITTHGYAKSFADKKKGGIILLSSLLAFQGVPLTANYAATKAYVQTLAEGIRKELKPYGVDVIASAPGPVKTGFASRAKMTMTMYDNPHDVAKNSLKALGKKTTVRPGFISRLLALLMSTVPRSGRTFILSQVMKDMTKI
ncbi:SDR family NAD(P)-dependent oxidoreductase [Leptospira sp. GIMC2001]|uniref:SDR family NAD(P)-dependent oxidoreductase n=1 Tax=Leptospira sp. GIMC2001 TaxID=1513297 RepID=UPI00234A20FC|nr:SDR family NAD(P)-dependent oxidoreductase [Leptospira sp. GIMC2001]WCL49615.1 SDR family NAD(P)-dependent oxidoreductase [Leptospira sp. GIMC2001]